MNNLLAFAFHTPDEVASLIAKKVKARRLELDLTQEGLAKRAGLKFSTYRRFEQTGQISLKGLLHVGFALDAIDDFNALFAKRKYRTLEDVLKEYDEPRKRGKKNE